MEKMPEIYDVILLGTGITECLLANFLCKDGKKVLMIDSERFSGGQNGSIGSLEDLQKLFDEKLPQKSGEWNVDLTPKLFVGEDKMMKLLKKVDVQVKCKPIHNILLSHASGVATIPNSVNQVTQSKFIPDSEKINYKKLINFSKQLGSRKLPPKCENPKTLLTNYNLGIEASQVLLHAMVVNCNEKPTEYFLNILGRFCEVQHHHSSSVFYPMYGIGEIINALKKKISSKGGRCMLNRPVENITKSDGMILVEARGLSVLSKLIVGAPSYFTSSVTSSQKVIRCLGLVDRFPVDTGSKSHSCFLTIPGNEMKKIYDTYVLVTGEEHETAPSGWFVVHASTVLETENPKQEIERALMKLQNVRYLSVRIEDAFCGDFGMDDKIFISSSSDYTMSWDSVCDDVMRLYEKITGKNILI